MGRNEIDPELKSKIEADIAEMDAVDADAGNEIKSTPQKAKSAVCPDCNGRGLKDEFTHCPRCKGEGHITVLQ